MKAQELIQELGKAIKIPDLALNSSNVCRVIFDKLAIDFETLTDQDVLYLISSLGPIPEDNKELYYRYLLEANFFGIATGGASLSLDTNKNQVFLHKILDVSNMEYSTFEKQVHEFYAYLKFWKSNYANLKKIDFGQDLIQKSSAIKV